MTLGNDHMEKRIFKSMCACQVNIAQTNSHDSPNFGSSRNGTGRIHGPLFSRGFLVPFGAGSNYLKENIEPMSKCGQYTLYMMTIINDPI